MNDVLKMSRKSTAKTISTTEYAIVAQCDVGETSVSASG